MSEIKQSKILVDELGGLLLQSLATAPPGANQKNFKYSIAQPLDNMTTIPTFGKVTTLIQSALSKVKAPASLAPGSIPSDVEISVQAIRPAPRYTAPHRRSNNPSSPNPSGQQTNSGKFLLEKTSFYQGKLPNNSHCQKSWLGWSHPSLYWMRPSDSNSGAGPPSELLTDSHLVALAFGHQV
jgi:hypothetical protein